MTEDGSDLQDFNADEWSKMFGTSAYCIPCNEDYAEEFDNGDTQSQRYKNNTCIEDDVIPQEMQGINPSLQPTQTFSEKTIKERSNQGRHLVKSHPSKPQETSNLQPGTYKETVDVVQHKAMDRNQPAELPNQTTPVSRVKTSPKVGWTTPLTLPETKLKLNLDTPRVKVELPTPTKQIQHKPEPALRRSTHFKTQNEPINYNKLGGVNLVELSEEPAVDAVTIGHIANQCAVYFAAYGIDCEAEADLSKDTIACLQKLVHPEGVM